VIKPRGRKESEKVDPAVGSQFSSDGKKKLMQMRQNKLQIMKGGSSSLQVYGGFEQSYSIQSSKVSDSFKIPNPRPKFDTKKIEPVDRNPEHEKMLK